jgi:hypothetical protein
MMTKLRVFLTLVFTSLFLGMGAQTIYNMSTATTTITCASVNLFFDSGGSGANYANNSTLVQTFVSNTGSCIAVTFGAFATEGCCDQLFVYDGPSTSSPLLGVFAGASIPGSFISTGTSLTFYFNSDGSVRTTGWTATLTCPSACSGTPTAGTAAVASSSCSANAGTVNLSITGGTGLSCGLTYAWQSAKATAGPWGNVPQGFTPTLTTNYVGTTFYRRVSTCGSNSITTNTISVSSSTNVLTCSLSNYTSASTTYSFDTFVGTVLPTTDDVLYTSILTLGFPVCISGAMYWGGYAASNGAFVLDAIPCFPNVSLNTIAASGVSTDFFIYRPAPTQSTSIPRNAILAPWTDIDPSLGGTIRYGTLGTAPNRRFVLSFEGVPMFSCGTSSPSIYFTSQIKIFEQNNVIEIHVGNKGVCPGWNNGAAVMGLHSYDGKTYIPPVSSTAHNSSTGSSTYTWSMSNTAYRFAASCATTGAACSMLPIDYKSFYCENNDGSNHINWQTATEKNIKNFSVERSEDAINFTDIGAVLPKNKPDSKYEFVDNLYKRGITNYYRITSTEYNGTTKSTMIYPVNDKLDGLTVMNIFPNPAKNKFYIPVSSKNHSNLLVEVLDMYGNSVKTIDIEIKTGYSENAITCHDLVSGIYTVNISDKYKGVVVRQKLLLGE